MQPNNVGTAGTTDWVNAPLLPDVSQEGSKKAGAHCYAHPNDIGDGNESSPPSALRKKFSRQDLDASQPNGVNPFAPQQPGPSKTTQGPLEKFANPKDLTDQEFLEVVNKVLSKDPDVVRGLSKADLKKILPIAESFQKPTVAVRPFIDEFARHASAEGNA